MLAPWKKSYGQPRQCIKKQKHYFAHKVHIVKTMVFPVVRYGCELNYKEGWAPNNWYFWTVVLEMTLESPLDCKEIKPVNCNVNQSWIFIGMTDVEAEALIFWPPDAKSDSLGKTLMLGKIEGRGEGDDRGWNGWMASPIESMWVWASSGWWWKTGKPSVLQPMRSQRVRHDWATE